MNIFLDTFDEYGWVGIAGLFMCMIIFILLRKFGNQLKIEVNDGLSDIGKELTSQMKLQNEELIHTIMDQQKMLIDHIVKKDRQEELNHQYMLNERMFNAEDINMKLKDIMNIHNSQRAFILEFHNSYKNLSGVPFAKYSCNYEWFDKGLMPLGYRCIGLPFGSIAKVVQDIIMTSNQQVIYTDMEKFEDENPSLMSLLKDKEITAIVYTGMYDNKNTLIGLLVLEYQTKVDINNINLHQLSIESAQLTSILNIRYKYTT